MKSKTWAMILGGVLAVCLTASVLLFLPREPAAYAEIWSDGERIETVSLSVDRVLTVESKYGTNVVTVKDGKIAVTEADCPDHCCMERGWCGSGTQIVCPPNRLVIKFRAEQASDGIAG